MNPAVLAMLENYQCHSRQDYENALKEIIQEIALLGLWRSKFFEFAAFYGGTALRILYGLDRFSEDLDFSLLKPHAQFNLTPYTKAIQTELNSLGFDTLVTIKDKNQASNIQSAFIKAETLKQLLLIDVHPTKMMGLPKDQRLKVKLEVDINPPAHFCTEAKILLNPIPFSVLSYQLPDLFAGKIHAALCRPWVSRVKGRDWYDIVWYIARKTPVRLIHLQERLLQTKTIDPGDPFTAQMLQDLLQNKINQIDFAAAKKDVLPFIRDPAALSIWSRSFFTELVSKLTFI